ncbi:YcaO-like family protein [Limosilactobacillus allomucosae]|uniref:YcaO-like family protein n=1 Tax=Limosilactobacillus allomucosae TaxID=3142938 RepID=A0ABV0I501_9LACO
MKIRNDVSFLKERLRIVGGNLTGIWDKNTFFIGSAPYPLPRINYITSTLVNVSPLVYKNKVNILYHLSGYGSNTSEARLSFLGESSERYAFAMMPITLKKDILLSSYKELCSKYDDLSVLPLEYVNIFAGVKGLEEVTPKDKIYWVKLNSLLDPNKIIWVPLQFIMFHISSPEKNYNVSAVSTGTASHEDIKSALRNSLIEYLQIDSYNLWWYGGHKGKELSVDLKDVITNYLKGGYDKFIKHFKVKFTDISFDKSIWVVVCEIEGIDSRPKYTVGLQGSLNLEKAIYRSFMEALTVMAYSINMSWLKPEILKNAKTKLGKMNDLDQNVAYYAMHSKPELKVNNVTLAKKDKKSTNLNEMIRDNRELLQWAGVVNITPHEFSNLNMNIIRLFAPKLLPVAMPSFPPVCHPRYKETGGIVNYEEHPMA